MSAYHEERAVSAVINIAGWIVAIAGVLAARFLWRRA